jgi:hypothetical protein
MNRPWQARLHRIRPLWDWFQKIAGSLWRRTGRPLWQRYRPPWSLRRATTLRLWREAELPWWSKLGELGAALWRRMTSSFWPFLWIAGASIGLLAAAPAHWTLSALRRDDAARGFLETLWQVDAAAIGLSVAIVLFAFELVWSTRYRGTLRRFAEEVWLVYVLALGLAALFTIGADLLGFGSGAPGGWAATWAAATSALALASLPVLLLRAVAATDPETLHERNLRQVRDLTIAATEQDIFRRLALGILKQEADSAGVDMQVLWFSDPPPGAKAVYPRKAGTVTGIRLRRVRRIGSGEPGSQQGAVPSVLVEIGKYVGPDTAIAIVPNDASKAQERAARRSIKVTAERRRDLLRDAIEKLHEGALEAIRSGLPVSYGDIADEYLEILIALPTAWRRYGVAYAGRVAGGASPFEMNSLDWLGDNLWEELREASRGTSREVARAAFFLPYRVAIRAIDLNASALFTKMLALYVQLYPVVREAPDGDVRRLLVDRCVDHPTSLPKMALAHELRKETLSEQRRLELEDLLERAFRTIAELAKVAMEEDPRDTATTATINADWDEVFEQWDPEYSPPDPFHVQQIEQQLGPNHPEGTRRASRSPGRNEGEGCPGAINASLRARLLGLSPAAADPRRRLAQATRWLPRLLRRSRAAHESRRPSDRSSRRGVVVLLAHRADANSRRVRRAERRLGDDPRLPRARGLPRRPVAAGADDPAAAVPRSSAARG